MEQIIQEMIIKSINEVTKRVVKILKDGEDFVDLVENIKEVTDKLGREICQTILESVDESIKKNSSRKKYWHVERRADKKTILTKLGEIEYYRTYYCSKKGDKYRYLTDDIFGIVSHEKIDKGLEAKVIELASEISYSKSGKEACKVEISGQTVMNKVRNLNSIKIERIPDKKKEIEYLYIEADEDHVALQGGGCATPRIIYIHEGKVTKGKRNSLVEPYYVSCLKAKPETIWEEVYEHIRINYDVDKLKRIYISGDGANWIKTGLDVIPKSRFVLDRYHMNKYVIKACANNLEYRPKLWRSLNLADKEGFKKLIDELYSKTESENKKEEITDVKKYMLNNWEGIEIQAYEAGRVLGCSAEGHVSHLLSARMSSRPLGWSREGVDCMSRLRAFIKNGGKVYDFLKWQQNDKKIGPIGKKILREAQKAVKRKFNEGINNIEILKRGQKSELFLELKQLRYQAL